MSRAPLTITETDRMPALIAELTAMQVGVVTVGFHADDKARDGSTNAEIAACHEFGTDTIPRRPFLGPALDKGKAVLGDAQAKLVGQVLDGSMRAEQAFGHLGELGVLLVQQEIRSGTDREPLKPATIEAKGSSTPLIDTGEMLRAVSYEVDMSGGSRG